MATTQWKRFRSVRELSAKTTVWSLPTDDEHVFNTGSPEDLLLDPEDFDIAVSRVQEHETVWTRAATTDTNWYTFSNDMFSEFYVVDFLESEF